MGNSDYITSNYGGEIWLSGMLLHALYVPQFTVCLQSVPQFDICGLHTIFGGGKATLLNGDQVILTASRSEDSQLYLLPRKSSTGVSLLSTAGGVSLDIWHKRFAHLNSASLK